MIKKNIWNLIFILSIFMADRLSKILIINSAETFGELDIFVTSFLNFNLIWNDGIAFGLFSFEKKIYYNFLTILIILITLIILWMITRTEKIEKLAFMMIFGGSVGNIFDRLYYSSVPDFIDIHFNNFHWFIFNVADIFITFGVILLIYLEIFSKKKDMKKYSLLLTLFFILSACQSMEDALTLKKKNNSDEFLVEKKSPLVLPPNYGELPLPGEEINEDRNSKNNEIQVTFNSDEIKINETIKNSTPSSLEKSVLEKIK